MVAVKQAFYEARPMVGIEYASHENKAWMVVETNRPHGGADNIVAWSYQGKPEHNEANARMVARALNNQQVLLEAALLEEDSSALTAAAIAGDYGVITAIVNKHPNLVHQDMVAETAAWVLSDAATTARRAAIAKARGES